LTAALTLPVLTVEVEAADPCRIRYGCFVPDLTGLASGTPGDFRAGI